MAYTVRSGDSMSAIAARHKVALQALIQANPQVRNPNLIHPGQRLNIPGRRDDFVSAPSTPKTSSGAGSSYTVRSGDTLQSVAHPATIKEYVRRALFDSGLFTNREIFALTDQMVAK